MPTFWTLQPESLHTHASLGSLEKAAETVPLSKLRRGLLVGVDLGPKAQFARSKQAFQFGPSGKKTPAGSDLVDLFRNRQAGCFVASPRLAEVLVKLDPAVSLSRVKLVDVKGLDHAFVLTAPLVDALDLSASGAKVEKADDEIVRAKKLVLVASKVPAERAVFRVPFLDNVWFVRDRVKDALADFVGLELGDPAAMRIGG